MEALEGMKRAQPQRGQPTTTQPYAHCTPFKLPSSGTIEISPEYTITLTAEAVFTPSCNVPDQSQNDGDDGNGVTSVADMRDPFHASITPQAYATGAATVIAWMLVIMLIITPRTFFVGGGASGRSGLMGRRGMIGGASGGGSVIGVGTRPWLQKVAALTVAVSLTLATADTFKIAEKQYEGRFMDAVALRNEVVSGMEIKVSRVISDVFLWLAQVQTLIRLFPRHKEKVIIKWVGFGLILLDIIFSSLNSFGPYKDERRPRHFETAIPALSYLFQLSLSMLYAAWVMYYAITKRRYAFYHPMMWNIALVALLSMVAILTPVVFFITDISNYSVAGWGDYFRWVGAAAASVIVWEWVERIEALEREERKDGILGREIYDGDEMLDNTPSHELNWPRSQHQSYMSDEKKKPGDGAINRGGGTVFTSGAGLGLSNLAHRLGRSIHQQSNTETPGTKRSIHIPAPAPTHRRTEAVQGPDPDSLLTREPPPVVASPVSRTDTTSADSTVYTIRYHPITMTPVNNATAAENRLGRTPSNNNGLQIMSDNADPEKAIEVSEDRNISQSRGRWHWQAVANPFKRRGRSPPPEVQRGRVIEPLGVDDVASNIPPRNYAGLALKDRLGTLAAQQGERFRRKKSAGQQSELNLPVTIIPAQPRGRTWSPEILLQQQQVLGQEQRDPPRSLPAEAEGSRNSSGGDEDEEDRSGESEHDATRSSPTRVRFTPETFRRAPSRPYVDPDNSAPSMPPTSIALGTELREVPFEGSDTPASSSTGATRHSTPTNHDR